jgi:protein-tyrosine phosphatase
MGYFPAKEIRPGLWIGSEGDSKSEKFMRDNNIAFVVNCSKNIPFLALPGVDQYRIPIDDSTSNNDVILTHFPIVVRAIDSVLQRGRGVLVHCRAGMQRSAATVAAYLMYKYNLSAANAMAAIKARKNETFWPTPTFAVALQKYEKQLATFNVNNIMRKRNF